MSNLILAAIQAGNTKLLNLLLSIYPRERWFDLDGTGSSVAHYICASNILVEGEYIVEAMKMDHENHSDFTPAMVSCCFLEEGFHPNLCGMRAIEPPSLLIDISIKEKNSKDPLIKIFFKNIEAILNAGEITENQLILLPGICEKIPDVGLKVQLYKILIRFAMLSGNYAKAKFFINKVTLPENQAAEVNNGTSSVFAVVLEMLVNTNPIIPSEVKNILFTSLPFSADNLSLALVLLSYVDTKLLSDDTLRYLEMHVPRICSRIRSAFDSGAVDARLCGSLDVVTVLSSILERVFQCHIEQTGGSEIYAEGFKNAQKKLYETADILEEILWPEDKYQLRSKLMEKRSRFLLSVDQYFPQQSSIEPFEESAEIVWPRFDEIEEKTLINMALLWAISRDHVEMMRVLLRFVSEKFVASGIGGASLFHYLAAEGTKAEMECFIAMTEPEVVTKELVAVDIRGRTPYYHAVLSNNKKLLDFFSEKQFTISDVFPIERAVSNGNLKELIELYEAAPRGELSPLLLLKRAIEGRHLHLFAYLVPKIGFALTISENAHGILNRIQHCFGANSKQALHELIHAVPVPSRKNAIDAFIYAAAEAAYEEPLLALIDLYDHGKEHKEIAIITACKNIALLARNPKEEKIYLITKILKKYFSKPSFHWAYNTLQTFDDLYMPDYKLADILILALQYNSKWDELEPLARCQAELSGMIDGCIAGKEIDVQVLDRIIKTIGLSVKANRTDVFQSMLLPLYGALHNGGKYGIPRVRLGRLIQIVSRFFSEFPKVVTEENRLRFSNIAFGLGEFRMAYALSPIHPPGNLEKLSDSVAKLVTLLFSELNISLPEEVRTFYCENVHDIARQHFIADVAILFISEPLKIGNLTTLSQALSLLEKQVNMIKFSSEQPRMVDSKIHQFGFSLNLVFQTIKQLEKLMVNSSEKLDISQLKLSALEKLKQSCEVMLLCVSIFKLVVKKSNTELLKGLAFITIMDQEVDSLFKSLEERFNQLSDRLIALQFSADLEPAVKPKNKKGNNKNKRHNRAQEKKRAKASDEKAVDASKGEEEEDKGLITESPIISQPLPRAYKPKFHRPVLTVPASIPKNRGVPTIQDPSPVRTPILASTTKPDSPKLETPSKREECRAETSLRSSSPVFFASPRLLPPFNKIPRSIIKLLSILEDFSEKQKIPSFFGNIPVYALLFGGMVRDCYLLDEVKKDADILLPFTVEQVRQLFPEATSHGEGRSCRIIFERIPVDFKLIQVDALLSTLQALDFTANAMAYHPKTGLIDFHQSLDAINKKELRHVQNSKAIFRDNPERVLRALRFVKQFGWDLSVVGQAEINLLCRTSGMMYDLMMHVQLDKLKSEYAKLIEALTDQDEKEKLPEVAFKTAIAKAHAALKEWCLYDVHVARGVIPVEHTSKAEVQMKLKS